MDITTKVILILIVIGLVVYTPILVRTFFEERRNATKFCNEHNMNFTIENAPIPRFYCIEIDKGNITYRPLMMYEGNFYFRE